MAKETSGGFIVYRDKVGDLHREDGPAVAYRDGSKEFWHRGEQITEDRLGIGAEPVPADLVAIEPRLVQMYEKTLTVDNNNQRNVDVRRHSL